ncbi:TetR family transcriptional regulator [Mycobacterium sp. NPDC048908]|uniref:TetR family transcriptional regulator n=1 Tax=Mycobacterium sp. NPDC048908 TaxID=3364292 RepID=UPI00371E7CB4
MLDAAEQVLTRGGPQALTLQAVADAAGVSKGGLLYHFSNKSELVRGLVERLVDDTNSNYAQWDDGRPGAYTRAYIASTCHSLTTADADRVLRRWAVILAASTEPDMQGPIAKAFEAWMWPEPGVDSFPLRAQIARLAADGLWWNAMFVKAFRDPELNKRIAAALVDYAEGRDQPEE